MEKERHASEAPLPPAMERAETLPSTSFEETIREDARREIAQFGREVEEIADRLQVIERFDRLDVAMDESQELLEKEEPVESEELDRYLEEAFTGLEERFRPGAFEAFQEWIKERVQDTESPLRKEAESWARQQTVAAWWDQMAKGLDGKELGKELGAHAIDTVVVERLEKLTAQIDQRRKPWRVRTEKMLQQYALHFAAHRAKNPSWGKKLFGTNVRKELQDVLRETFATEWLRESDALGRSNADRLMTAADFDKEDNLKRGALEWKPLAFDRKEARAALDEVRGLAFGEKDFEAQTSEPKRKDWNEYRHRNELGASAEEAIKVLQPVLGRRAFVSEISFEKNSDRPEESKNADGTYDWNKRLLCMYDCAAEDPTTFVRVLAHESGHAMQLERSLSLPDAIRFGIEMNATVMKDGYVSRYSQTAQDVYLRNMQKRLTERGHLMSDWEKKKLGNFITDSDIREEWAEMLAFSAVPSVLHRISPVKAELVKRYAAKFGFDVDQARERIAASLPQPIYDPRKPTTWGSAVEQMVAA